MNNAELAAPSVEDIDGSALGEHLLWRGCPSLDKIPLGFLALGMAFFFLACKGLCVELYALIFKTFPPLEWNWFADAFLAGAVATIIFRTLTLRRPRKLRRSGHLGYALTRSTLIIVGKGSVERFGSERFEYLGDVTIRSRAFLTEMTLNMNAGGKDAGPPIKLYGVQDPSRVACLIRATLAPHTLAKNIKGNLA